MILSDISNLGNYYGLHADSGQFDPYGGFEPETFYQLNAASIPYTNAATIYPGVTGIDLWDELNNLMLFWKSLFSQPTGQLSLRNLFPFIYFYLGNTAIAQAHNLVDPGAYSITFNGPFTHDNTGCQGNGISSYESNGFTINTNPANTATYFKDLKTNANGLFADFGGLSGTQGTVLLYARNGGNYIARLHNALNFNFGPVADSLGLYLITRGIVASFDAYKEGALVGTGAAVGGSHGNQTVVSDAVNNAGVITQFSPRKTTLYGTAGVYMDLATVTAFTNSWRAFDNFLGR